MKGATLRTRVVLLLLFLSLVPPAIVAWVAQTRVRHQLRLADEMRFAAAFREFDAALEREGLDLLDSLATAADLVARDPALRPQPAAVAPGREAASAPGRDAAGPVAEARAAGLMQEAGLDCLAAIDRSGRILWSGHHPASAGTSSAGGGLPAGRPLLVEDTIRPGVGRVPTLQSRRPVRAAGAEFDLLGGRLIDSSFLSRLSPGGTVRAALIDGEGAVVAASRPDDPLPAPPRGGEGILDARGVPHRYRTRALAGPDGMAIGALVAAVSLGPTLEAEAAIRRAVILVVVAGILLSALVGVLLGRGVTRPLRRLEEMSGRLASERYDDLEAVDAPGEIGDLARAFGRMAAALKESRIRLRQTERLAAAEEVARRVAHEIKNPLAPIALMLEAMVRTRRLRPDQFDATFEDGVRTIQEEVRRMRGVLEDFSRFGRLPASHPRPADLNGLVRRVLALHAENSAGARIETDLDDRLPLLSIDPDRMAEVLNNLVVNSIQALGATGGAVQVTTRCEEGAAVLAVRDSGPGLPEEVRRRLFEPYVSSRAGGTGLGLAIARRIVLDHGGAIEAAGPEVGGAEIRIRLPLPAPGGAAAPDGAAIPDGERATSGKTTWRTS